MGDHFCLIAKVHILQ